MTAASTAPKLLSSEQRQLAAFILASAESRAEILQAAINSPTVSGCLVQCYRWALTV